jgi:hypothetical protein
MGLWVKVDTGLPRRTADRSHPFRWCGTLPSGVPRQRFEPVGFSAYRQSRAVLSLPDAAYELERLARFSAEAGVVTGSWAGADAGTMRGAIMGTARPIATNWSRLCSAMTLDA